MAIDFAKCLGWVVLVLVALYSAKRVICDIDTQDAEPQPQPVPDAAHEPHWIDPALDFFGVECRGKDE